MTLEEYISKKKLADGTTLGLKTWESDLLCPGRRMYQIDLVDDCTTLRFPTNYEDFAISETLFHWQSQSTTSVGSNTGRRYITHEMGGSEILLFARKEKYDENNITAPYYFLGSASYVSHEGEKPMSIIWRLHKPLSPYLLSIFSH